MILALKITLAIGLPATIRNSRTPDLSEVHGTLDGVVHTRRRSPDERYSGDR